MCAPTQLISAPNSSLAIMLTFCQSLCQGHFCQWASRWDPHHQDPDASGPKSWQGPYFGLNIKAKPIPMLKKKCHRNMSDLNSLFRLVRNGALLVWLLHCTSSPPRFCRILRLLWHVGGSRLVTRSPSLWLFFSATRLPLGL